MCKNNHRHCLWRYGPLPNMAALVMIALHLLASISMGGASGEVLRKGSCSADKLEYQQHICISFDVAEVEFRPYNDAYYTTKDLCRKFGNPIAVFNSSQCLTKSRDVMFNYTDSNDTWVFSLQMKFAELDDIWKLNFINFTNATKPGIHSYSYSVGLQGSNDFYAYLGQAYQCDMVSFMDDKKTTGITFTNVMVQPFGSSNPSDVRYCHDTSTSAAVVGIVIGTVVGAFVVLALVTVVIILVHRRLRYGNYNLLDS